MRRIAVPLVVAAVARAVAARSFIMRTLVVRACVALLAVTPAFAAVAASDASGQAAAPMGEDDARHLLERTGFGATPANLADYARLTRDEAIRRLLDGVRTTPSQRPPALVYEAPGRKRTADEAARKALRRDAFAQAAELRAWWLQEMLTSPSPLGERMTLFWHNHFVSSQQKVKSAKLMLDQNLLLRHHALGNFRELLHAVAKDPAMLVYLDGAGSRREQPNENFAREVMELFTLGEGHYSERDIKEAARAFTGWSVDRETGSYRWRPRFHDDGEKTVLGVRGRFGGDEVLDLLLRQPATAKFIAGKLWREFVSPTADPDAVREIAGRFRASGYDIRAALRALFSSRAFWAAENRGTLVKSPVDLVVGTLRTLDIACADALPLAFAVRQLGQDLFAPPNVRGWPGGDAWIDASTLPARRQFLNRLLRAGDAPAPAAMRETTLSEPPGGRRLAAAAAALRFDEQRWLTRFGSRAAIVRALLAVPPVATVPAGLDGGALVRTLILDPAFQLK